MSRVGLQRTVSKVVAGMVGAAGIVATMATPAAAAPSAFRAPVYAGDFPDAAMIVVNGTYWAYATGSAGRNLQVMRSTDLRTWSAPADPLPALPSWAAAGLTWAPGVVRLGSTFVMYYTVHDVASGRQCISLATSATPGGTFTDSSSGPLICQTANGGSIDPSPFLDPVSGNLYLVWKSDDNALGAGTATRLWGQQLTPDGRALAGGTVPSLLLTQAWPWQAPRVEGPSLTRQGGRYYLFYGANNYDSASSGIGYATSSSLLGSYGDQSPSGPWVGTRGNAQGPQAPCVFTDATGATRMAFAAWYGAVGYASGGGRSLWVGSLAFPLSGQPTLS